MIFPSQYRGLVFQIIAVRAYTVRAYTYLHLSLGYKIKSTTKAPSNMLGRETSPQNRLKGLGSTSRSAAVATAAELSVPAASTAARFKFRPDCLC